MAEQELSKVQLAAALAPKEAAERELIDHDRLRQMSDSNIRAIEDALLHEIHVIAMSARKTADIYYELVEAERDDRKTSNKLFTRVRLVENSLQATWNYGSFTLETNGKKRFITRHIPKRGGRGVQKHQYPATAFKKAEPWEREIAEEAERMYVPDRRKAEIIGQMRRLLSRYKRLCESAVQEE